ncbi:MAG: hypothetical protein MI757_16350 [Pirellulales bacterium]|nr:hypothetical protein [Pirellulales bacterium]
MLYGTVTNDNQRQQFKHSGGPLNFGRLPHAEVSCVVINDNHVSRDQCRMEEIAGDKVRVENRGRSSLFFRDGTKLVRTEAADFSLPLHITVGRTVIEVSTAPIELAPSSGQSTFEADSYEQVLFLALVDAANDFQYPLATGYRQLNSFSSNAERYKELMRLAENVLAFIASLSLTLLDEERRNRLPERLGRPLVDSWQGGISPGDWLDLSIHGIESLKEQADTEVARGLAGLEVKSEKKGLGKNLRALIRAKNDFKHDRGPSVETEFRDGCIALCALLSESFEMLAFLKSHPIFLVRDVNPRRRGSMADIVLLSCMGNNPGFMTEQRVHPPTLRQGDLYLEAERGTLLPLYPFVIAGMCHQCKNREFYFIDRLDVSRKNTMTPNPSYVAGLKSFDRGHTEQVDEIGWEIQDLFPG